ncbi:transmembrane protein 272-like [Phyllobates terribilis]|uniref:transmembrane protein 272-like n=1 Tax=Phyllobates terribilis TaxID=111132 RepID=UPI003CCB6344
MSCCSLNLVVQIFTLVTWTALSIAMVVIGSLHINDCAIEPNIPIFLVVAGAVNLFLFVFLPIYFLAPKLMYFVEIILSFFNIAWFIAGSVWVFRIYETDPRDCNETLYKFAFGLLIYSYAYLGFSIVYIFLLVFSCIALTANN